MKALAANKKRHLIFVYVTQGYSAAKPLAIEYGINPKVMSKYARAAGIKGKRGRERKTIPKPRRIRPDRLKIAIEDRWNRAIGRGEISI